MAITNITVNFTECTPTPVNGYNIQYRIAGSGDPLIDAGNFSSSPANIPVSYPDGTLFEGIIRTDCGDGVFGQVVVWGQTPEEDACCRFAYPGEDEIANEERLFDFNGFNFKFIQDGTTQIEIDPATFSSVFGFNDGTASAQTQYNANSAGSNVKIDITANTGPNQSSIVIDGTNQKITLNAVSIELFSTLVGADPGYVWTLVDEVTGRGEWAPGGGESGGGATMRFGFPGEDDTAGEDRIFNAGSLYQVVIGGSFDTSVKDGLFKVENDGDSGVAIYGKSFASSTAVLGESATGIAGQFISTDSLGLNVISTNGLAASIASSNYIGAQITSDADYSVDLGVTGATNNSVLPNVKIKGITTSFPADDGFGQSIDMVLNTVDFPTVRLANQIISKWTTADDATRSSEISITGVDNAVTNILLTISGAGIFTLVQSLFDYADDTAAAAGTPVIPVNGLYRTGSFVKMRVA